MGRASDRTDVRTEKRFIEVCDIVIRTAHIQGDFCGLITICQIAGSAAAGGEEREAKWLNVRFFDECLQRCATHEEIMGSGYVGIPFVGLSVIANAIMMENIAIPCERFVRKWMASGMEED